MKFSKLRISAAIPEIAGGQQIHVRILIYFSIHEYQKNNPLHSPRYFHHAGRYFGKFENWILNGNLYTSTPYLICIQCLNPFSYFIPFNSRPRRFINYNDRADDNRSYTLYSVSTFISIRYKLMLRKILFFNSLDSS